MNRKPYPADLTDEQWVALEPLLPRPESGTRKGVRPAADVREVCDAVFHHLQAGAACQMLPPDFPPWRTVYGHFRAWRMSGAWESAHARLREECRLAAGAPPTPETLRVDSQTVETTHRGGPRGHDAGEKNPGARAVRGGRFARCAVGAAGHDRRRPGPGRRVLAAPGGGRAAAAGA